MIVKRLSFFSHVTKILDVFLPDLFYLTTICLLRTSLHYLCLLTCFFCLLLLSHCVPSLLEPQFNAQRAAHPSQLCNIYMCVNHSYPAFKYHYRSGYSISRKTFSRIKWATNHSYTNCDCSVFCIHNNFRPVWSLYRNNRIIITPRHFRSTLTLFL